MSYIKIQEEDFKTKLGLLQIILRSATIRKITPDGKVKEICKSLRKEDERFDLIQWTIYIHQHNLVTYEGYLKWLKSRQ